MRTVVEKKILPVGQKIALTEEEIDSVAVALQLITAEIAEGLSGQGRMRVDPASTG